MKHEKPQKHNPYQLVIRQHIFPTRSINRFINSNSMVEVCMLKYRKIVQLKADDIFFCARRTWDQRAEESYMKEIEDQYQDIIPTLEMKKISFSKDENKIISDFYALCNIRSHFRDQNQDFMTGGEPEINLTKEDEELLESNRIGFIRSGGIIPGRQIVGIDIQLNLFQARKQLKDIKWILIEAEEGEFIVPDNFLSDLIVPLTPSSCFVGFNCNRTITRESVAKFNKKAIETSKNYYFAKCFSNCPGFNGV